MQCGSCSDIVCLACIYAGNACMCNAETCLQTLDEVLLPCLDDFVVFARYVMLLAEPLHGTSFVESRFGQSCTLAGRTIEAEDFRPYSSMMLLVSLPSISSGTETFTASARCI